MDAAEVAATGVCRTALDCIIDCLAPGTRTDAECKVQCTPSAPAPVHAALAAIEGCVSGKCKSIGDLDCVIRSDCLETYNACYGGRIACLELFDCLYWGCGELAPCQAKCIFQSEPTAIAAFLAVHDCWGISCPHAQPPRSCTQKTLKPGGTCFDLMEHCRRLPLGG